MSELINKGYFINEDGLRSTQLVCKENEWDKKFKNDWWKKAKHGYDRFNHKCLNKTDKKAAKKRFKEFTEDRNMKRVKRNQDK